MATLKSPTKTVEQPEAAADLARALSGPLGNLLAMGELVSRQPLGEAAGAQVRAIIEAGQRMARLIDDALEIRGLSSPSAFEAVNLREIIDDVETLWRSREHESGASLLMSCAFAPDLRVLVDSMRLRRFLNNLIERALQGHTRGVVDVQISAHADVNGDVLIRGGVDVPNGVESSDAIGLALCRAIALQMDGEVRQNSNPGSGSHITFELKLEQASQVLALETDAPDEEAPLPARTHLLIVDDNATNRIVAAALCEMFGCTSETAEDGLEAVDAVQARRFDLILMDIKMPRMDGLGATKAIRALPGPAAETPIVALTANADAEAVAVYLASGMQGVVDKPIKPAQLLSALQNALNTPRAVDQRSSSAA
jgi:CheY-like chemotaxis protein